MIRPLSLSLAAGIALLTATLCCADETFPVVHNEPITVRILGGKDGQPLAHLHLVLLAGYDQGDLHGQLYRAELLTDAHGQVHLPKQLANLPWLQVWVAKKQLCQANPRGESFSVELIRRDGVSAPNLCGTATVEDVPGIFTVFVKSKEKNAPAVTLVAKAEAKALAPVAVAIALPAAVAPAPAEKVLKPAESARKPAEAETRPPAAQIPAAPIAATLQEKPAPAPAEKVLKPAEPARKPAEAETRPPAAQIPAAPVVATLQEKPAPTPAEKVLKPTEPARPVAAAPAAVPSSAPAVVATSRQASDLARAAAYRRARRVAMRPVSHRATPVSHSARPVTHRAKPMLASCEVRKPRAKAAPPASSSPKSEDKPPTALDTTHKSKPAAGVRLEAATPSEPKVPLKKE